MDKQKTVREWLLQLPLHIRLKALHNMKNYKPYTGERKADSMNEALCDAFKWRHTKEGWDYWEHVRVDYCRSGSKEQIVDEPKTVVINCDIVAAFVIITTVVALFFMIWLRA